MCVNLDVTAVNVEVLGKKMAAVHGYLTPINQLLYIRTDWVSL